MPLHRLALVARVPFVTCVVNGDRMTATIRLFGLTLARVAL